MLPAPPSTVTAVPEGRVYRASPPSKAVTVRVWLPERPSTARRMPSSVRPPLESWRAARWPMASTWQAAVV